MKDLIAAYMPDRGRTIQFAVLVTILLAGLLIRLPEQRQKLVYLPFVLDEAKYENTLSDLDIADSDWNYLAARNLSRGNGLSVRVHAPFVPTMYRSPGYPLTLGASFALFGEQNARYVMLTLFLLGIMLFAVVLWVLFGYSVAAAFLLLVSFLSGQFLWRYAMANTYFPLVLFLFGLYLLLFTLFQSNRADRMFCFLLGLATAAIILTRSEFMFLPVFSIAAITILRFKEGRKRLIMLLAAFFIGILVLYSPWVIRNKVQFDTFSPGGRGGLLAAHRGLAARAVAAGMDYWDFHRRLYIDDFALPLTRKWVAEGKGTKEMILLEQEVGRQGMALIKQNLGGYLRGCWEEFACGQSFNPSGCGMLGPPEASFFASLSGREPSYRFTLLCFGGLLATLFLFPKNAVLLFHLPAYFVIINSMVNSSGCMYVTTVILFYYVMLAVPAGIALQQVIGKFVMMRETHSS